MDGPKPEPQPIPDPVEVVPPPVQEPVEAETDVKPDSEEPGYEYPVPEVPLELPRCTRAVPRMALLSGEVDETAPGKTQTNRQLRPP